MKLTLETKKDHAGREIVVATMEGGWPSEAECYRVEQETGANPRKAAERAAAKLVEHAEIIDDEPNEAGELIYRPVMR